MTGLDPGLCLAFGGIIRNNCDEFQIDYRDEPLTITSKTFRWQKQVEKRREVLSKKLEDPCSYYKSLQVKYGEGVNGKESSKTFEMTNYRLEASYGNQPYLEKKV